MHLYPSANCLNSQSKEEKYFIHNHLSFTVKFHRDVQTELARIVGFEVNPYRLLNLGTTCSIYSFILSGSSFCGL